MASASEQKDEPMAEASSAQTGVPEGYTEIREGKAAILQRANDVFFNPAQVINRDMSTAVLKYFVKVRAEEIASGKLKPRRGRMGAVPPVPGAAAAGPAAAEGQQQQRPAAAEAQEPAVNGAAAEGAPEQQQQQPAAADPRQQEEEQAAAKARALAEFAGTFRVLEGLAASGLRAIRYATEIEGVSEVVANDLDPNVVAAMRQNIAWNGGAAAEKVTPSVGDARLVALQAPCGFEAVDLDPYGSPSQLLDSAVQAVAEGGLLLVTATDMATLCGNNGEACFAKYASYPLHKPYCHEMALRILLASIATHAARYKRYIVPVLSLSIDFYIRVFVRVYTSAAEVKNAACKLGYVWQSQGCDSFYWQRTGRRKAKDGKQGGALKFQPGLGPAVPQACPETGAAFSMGGPYWADPIHDPAWIQGVLHLIRSQKQDFPAYDRIHSILTAVSEELLDVPLYFDLHSVCKTLHCTAPRADTLRSALVNAGYRVSSSHACALGVKTDAPWNVVWDILRCWVADHPTRPPPPGSSMEKILSKEPELKADFSRAPQALSKAKQQGVSRFLPNPTANWGPKPKHRRGGGEAAKQGEEQAQGQQSGGGGGDARV